jgi:hypothetical protein
VADVKISELTAVSAVEANDLVEVSEDTGGGSYASKKATATQVRDFALSTAADQNSYMVAALTKPDIRPSLNLDFARVKTLDPRITFTRASEARYYDGKTTAKAEENLLLRSQDYSATWTVTNLTPVTGKTAPDTTSTATEFTAGAANATLTQSVTALAADYTFSVWLRRVTGTGDIDITAHSGGTWVTQSISGTWARYTVTQTLTAGACTPGIRVVTSGDVIEVWGAQLEQRSAATAYTATTTQPITNYVPQLLTAASGVARFDHNPFTGESLGLLIEEQRANLLTYSEDFSQAAWAKTNTSIESNIVVAPDGTLTADKIIESTNNSAHELRRNSNASVSALTAYTQSIYVKAAERTLGSLQMIGNSGDSIINFDLSNGTVAVVSVSGGWSNNSATIESVGNGWFLISHTATTNSGITGLNARLFVRSAAGNTSYTGDGYSGIYIWGAQLEAGAFPTSYIPTVASQVTRSADAASMTGTNFSSWYRQDEGTLFADGDTVDDIAGFVGVDDGTTSNRIRVFQNTSTTIRGEIHYNGTSQGVITSGTVTLGLNAKTGTAYKFNDFAISTNSMSIGQNTSTSIPLVDRLRVGNVDGSVYLNGHLKKIAYYPKRLTNAQLQALTK